MKIPLGMPIFDKEMEEAAVEALRNERFVLGESVYKFEEEFADLCGTKYAISTSSGTEALRIALVSAGVKPDETVITSPASFIATANAILFAQAHPLFADIKLSTYTISPELIRKSITAKTRGVIPVHLYGFPAKMDLINEIAKKHNLVVIEDACQAHGAVYNGKKIGSIGLAGCFSFYSSKNMTVCGDGGMITTDDENLALRAMKLRDCGRTSQYVHDEIGSTSRLNTVNAAIGRIQLKRLKDWNEKRRRIAESYNKLLEGIDGLVIPPKESVGIFAVYHLYVVRSRYRDELKTWLESHGIGCGVHYALPIHLQPIYRQMFGFRDGSFPVAEELCNTCLSLPIFPSLSEDQILYISEKIIEFFNGGDKN